MRLDRRSICAFLVKRLARLYPVHIVTLLVFVAAGILIHAGFVHSGTADTQYDFWMLPMNLLLLQAWGVHDQLTFNYVSWSVSGEWFAYLMFPLVVLVFLRGRLPGLVVMLALILAGLEYADRNATNIGETWYFAQSWGAYRVAADFVFGAILCVLVDRSRAFRYAQALAWAILVPVFWAMFSDASIYLTLALFGAAIYFAALADRDDDRATAWLAPLEPVTAVSFGVYMWHSVVELVAFSLLWKRIFAAEGIVAFWLYMPLPILASIAVAMLSARYFERPAGRWLQSVLMPAPAQRPATAAGT
jgi:Predicted acyltransferases